MTFANNETKDFKRILIMVAVDAERNAVVKGIGNDKRFEVDLCGVGPVSAAAKTANILAKNEYDLVINAGIAGAFSGRAHIGSVVIGSEIISGDLGAETSEGFMYVEELGFGRSRIPVDQSVAKKIVDHLSEEDNLSVYFGSILTLSTVTGSTAESEKLMARECDAVAEAMEGFGVAVAAHNQEIPILEIRSISNLVGPRDKYAWRIDQALASLEQAFSKLTEVL